MMARIRCGMSGRGLILLVIAMVTSLPAGDVEPGVTQAPSQPSRRPVTSGAVEGTEAWLTHTDVQVDLAGLNVQPFLSAWGTSECAPRRQTREPVADPRCLRWTAVPVMDAGGSIYFITGDL